MLGVWTEPVTAHEMMTLSCFMAMGVSLWFFEPA
jgi:hypothetical protein